MPLQVDAAPAVGLGGVSATGKGRRAVVVGHLDQLLADDEHQVFGDAFRRPMNMPSPATVSWLVEKKTMSPILEVSVGGMTSESHKTGISGGSSPSSVAYR